MSLSRLGAALATAWLAAATPLAFAEPGSAPGPDTEAQTRSLVQADAALQAGEADKALALLASPLSSGPDAALAHNLRCRVRLTLEQWDAAVTECELAVRLDGENSDDHLWFGRALGEKADRASFLTAYSLAKRTRAEFEEAVRLNPRNADALFDLGEFYYQAPGVVGGGIDKAQRVAGQLDQVDPARAHELRGDIAEQQKDFSAAENEYKQAIAAGAHPATQWTSLARFYAHRKKFDEMESAIHSVVSAAVRDKHAGIALYDSAGLLTETHRDPGLAVNLLEEYLAGSSKTEEAPAFVAHIRLARLKQQLGDQAAAEREHAAAMELAREYKPAQDFRSQGRDQKRDQDRDPQQARY